MEKIIVFLSLKIAIVMAQITGLFILVCFKFDLELVKVIPYSILFNNALKSRPELNWLTKILVQNLLLLITL